MAMHGALLALFGLCVLLIWRAGRLARRYDTPCPSVRYTCRPAWLRSSSGILRNQNQL